MSLLSRLVGRFRPPYSEPRAIRNKRVRFYAQFIREGDLVFDIGANEGSRTDAFLRLGARVVAIDPQQTCVRILRERFPSHPNLAIEPVAVGATEGEIELYTTSLSAIATVSTRFIEATHQSGRFSNFNYAPERIVALTTLDALIERHGEPAFMKLDVEGYEPNVLSGLSKRPTALRGLSFEFTPELLDATNLCLEHLRRLGADSANFSIGESMELAERQWITFDALGSKLRRFVGTDVFGDVYVRWTNTEEKEETAS